MKPAKFDYLKAESAQQAVAALDRGEGAAIVLAGGQTLVPMLSMRLARPDLVVDINQISDLSGITLEKNELLIGACTRQAEVLTSPLVKRHAGLLAKAIAFVGHQQTRNRGTVGGSLSHADPASEIPLAALALNAYVSLRSVSGIRKVALTEFFLGPMTTVRKDNELLISLHIPLSTEIRGAGFHEVSERKGDFAVVAAAAVIGIGKTGICNHATLAIGGADGTPKRMHVAENKLQGNVLNNHIISSSLSGLNSELEPSNDRHADAAYRTRVARILTERALQDALEEVRP